MRSTQAVIIVLLVANLAATLWFGLSDTSAPIPGQIEKAAMHDLPPVVTAEVRKSLLDEFSRAFNSADYDALYDMFGHAAKAQFTKESADKEFEKMIKWFHSVEGGAYTHSELAGTQGNTNIYVMHYAVTLSDKSDFGTAGTLRITLAVQGSEYQVHGIHLNAGKMLNKAMNRRQDGWLNIQTAERLS